MWRATYAIFKKKLPKVNYRPLGENSPNLVTLPKTQTKMTQLLTTVYETRIARMVCFHTKNTNLGKVWRALEWIMLVYFMIIWNIFWPFAIIYGRLV
jgi:hypothetical protein